jgi:hypothetical protein
MTPTATPTSHLSAYIDRRGCRHTVLSDEDDTESDLSGPGRLIGNVLSRAGKRLERWTAERKRGRTRATDVGRLQGFASQTTYETPLGAEWIIVGADLSMQVLEPLSKSDVGADKPATPERRGRRRSKRAQVALSRPPSPYNLTEKPPGANPGLASTEAARGADGGPGPGDRKVSSSRSASASAAARKRGAGRIYKLRGKGVVDELLYASSEAVFRGCTKDGCCCAETAVSDDQEAQCVVPQRRGARLGMTKTRAASVLMAHARRPGGMPWIATIGAYLKAGIFSLGL